MECKKTENMKSCACTYEPCSRKGVCCDCIVYHKNLGELPGCFFSKEAERSYDRTIEKFVSDRKNRWTADN
ncbi:MAG: hypothetical protein KAJ48_07825 [Elusimicrobiales bacterium]|nr:hypothetical protein [Elusimicrobiales bacterium]